MCVCEWSAGTAVVKTQARPHLRDFLMSDSVRQHLVSQSFFFFLDGTGVGAGRVVGGRRTEAPWCSDVEALSAATCALYVWIVEDKFTGQLWLHKVHLSSQKGQLSFLLYEHPHTVLQHLLVRLVPLLGIVQCVRQSIAATCSHSNLQTDLWRARVALILSEIHPPILLNFINFAIRQICRCSSQVFQSLHRVY